MKNILIAFAVLLAILTLISAFGGSLNREGFEDETFPEMHTQATESFWEEQQQALAQQHVEQHNNPIEVKEEFESQEPTEEPQWPTAEQVQENFASCGNMKENFTSCGNMKENFVDAEHDIEPYEDEKTYGAF
jgi:hypothetical protein